MARKETLPPSRPTERILMPEPERIGTLCHMALSLALETSTELAHTGRVSNVKIARTRAALALGAVQELDHWLRRQKIEAV